MNKEKREQLINEFRDTLLKTEREGMADLLTELSCAGFLEAPCSTRYHLAKEGGLLEHSVNVLHVAEKLSASLYGAKNLTKELKDSIAICALLHDVGKCGQFGKPLYIPKLLKNGKTGAEPYQTNKDLLALPHEVTSVVEITKFIDLTEEEQQAIAYHNGLYGCFKYEIQGKETPLYMIIHFADLWASRVVECETESKESKESEVTE